MGFIGAILSIVKLPVELLGRPKCLRRVASDSVEMKFGCNANVAPITGGRCREFPEGVEELCSAAGKE